MERTAATRPHLVAVVALATVLATGIPAAAATPARSAVPARSAMSALSGRAPVPEPSGEVPSPGRSGPADPALVAAIAAWVSGSGETDLETLAEDFTDLEQAAAASQLPAMATGCARLRTDVEAAQRHAPVPDASAQQSWAAALSLYDRGARDCVAGTTRFDPRLLGRASDEIISGSDRLQQLIDRLNEIG